MSRHDDLKAYLKFLKVLRPPASSSLGATADLGHGWKLSEWSGGVTVSA